MFDFLAKILGYVMRGCYWLTNNYVVALLLFALAMQVLMCPLGIKQQRNMVKQASLRPKEMAIRNKYRGRNDRVTMQKMQQEIMDLYKREGYSQFAGCLPLILQMLIIFPLYRVVIRPLEFVSGLTADLSNAICTSLSIDTKSATAQISAIASLRNGGAEAWGKLTADQQAAITELGGVDALPNMTLFGIDLGMTPKDGLFGGGAWLLILVPLLNLGFMYLSQYLSKKFSYQSPMQEQANGTMSSMKIMLLVLPLMTMFITFSFAAAIGIYWIFRTILSIGQQALFRYLMPYPQFTEEDYKNAQKALKGKKGNPKAYKNVNYEELGIRSLHHIDD